MSVTVTSWQLKGLALASDNTAPRVGHVHLKVADLDRAIAFYSGLLGFGLTQRYGDQAAFLGAGGYHHHIGLNTWHSAGGHPPAKENTGLYHSAFLYPDRQALAKVVVKVRDAGVDIYGSANHGVSEAFYFDDPDGNGVEIYWDKPQDDWPRNEDGSLAMYNAHFEVEDWLARVLT